VTGIDRDRIVAWRTCTGLVPSVDGDDAPVCATHPGEIPEPMYEHEIDRMPIIDGTALLPTE
jgi:hypothetical protein